MEATRLTVNGTEISVTAPPATPLLDVLRNHLGLMGTRYGCGLEQCGACMVLVDGEPVYACTREVGTVAGRQGDRRRGPRHAGQAAPAAAGLPRRAGRPVRLLPVRHPHVGQGAARPQPDADARRDRRGARSSSLPLRRPSAHLARRRTRRRALRNGAAHERARPADQPGRQSAPRPLDPFPAATAPCDRHRQGRDRPGRRHRLGQIAADELDVPLERIAVLSGDTDRRAERALHHRRLSIEMSAAARCGWSAPRCAPRLSTARRSGSNCSPRRAVGRRRRSSCRTAQRPARTTGPFAGEIDLARAATGSAPPKPAAAYRVVGRSVPRLDLPAKVSGAAFVHDVLPHGMLHARTLRQPKPRRDARGARRGRDPPRRQGRAADRARGQFRRLRQSDRERRRRPPPRPRRAMPTGTMSSALKPAQQEAAWLKGQPARTGTSARRRADRRRRRAPTSDHLAALYRARLDGAVLRAGRVPRRPSHGVVARQGMHPLRKNLAPALGSIPRRSPVQHLHGAGLLRPQRRRRCGARRGAGRHAPARPAHPAAMAARGGVWLRAGRPGHAGDPACRSRRARPAGRLDDRDLERPHPRPAAGRRRLPARLRGPARPAARGAADRPPEARGGGGTRNARAALRRPGASHPASSGRAAPVRTSALRGLGATAQRLRHRVADGRAGGARRRGSRRLPPVDPVRAAGPRG